MEAIPEWQFVVPCSQLGDKKVSTPVLNSQGDPSHLLVLVQLRRKPPVTCQIRASRPSRVWRVGGRIWGVSQIIKHFHHMLPLNHQNTSIHSRNPPLVTPFKY